MIDSQDDLRTAQEQTVDYQPGKVVFNKFKIIEKIGAGGMARVYKAEQIDLNRDVALKVLYSSIIDPRAIMRFQNEAKTTSKVVHQNIAWILDFGVSKEGEPYMAMELIEGMTLQRWLSLEGKLNLDDFSACSSKRPTHWHMLMKKV
ncbi:MAG: protein kinase [Candidatus Obscuribacterales bacterium]|nr:protein kinase [Candidatus Obscuribacterales bacterium]